MTSLAHRRFHAQPKQRPTLNGGHWFVNNCPLILPFFTEENLGTAPITWAAPVGQSLAGFENGRYGRNLRIADTTSGLDLGGNPALQTPSFTVLSVFQPDSIGSYCTIFATKDGGVAGVTARSNTSTGKIEVDKTATVAIYTSTNTVMLTGVPNVVGISYDGTSGRCTVAVNGRIDGTSTSIQTFQTGNFIVGFSQSGAASAGRQYLFCYHSMVANAAQLEDLTSNPWQIFRRPQIVYFNVAAAGGGSGFFARARNVNQAVNRASTY